MRRILLLGMAMLLGLAAHADDRQVIYEETFTEGLGSFTVIDEGFPDPIPVTWHWDESGCASITESKLADGYWGYSYLTSPIIDLTNWHNTTFSFEYNNNASSYILFTLQIKDGNSDWKDLRGGVSYKDVDEFRTCKTFFLSRYNGHQIQIRFLVRMSQYTKNQKTNKLRNIRFEGELGAASDEPVKVNNIQEFLALPEYTFAEIPLDTALFTCVTAGMSFMKDNSAAVCCRDAIDSKNTTWGFGPFPGLRFKGTITCVRTFEYGYNELSDGLVDGKEIYPEDEMGGGGYWTSFTKIDESQIEEYDCQNIHSEIKDPDMLFYYYLEDFSLPSYYKTHSQRIGFQAVAFLTPDHKKRLLFVEAENYGHQWGVYKDDEPYEYNEDYVNLNMIYRDFKKNQWNTVCLPYDINKSVASSWVFSSCQFAVFSNCEDGIIEFSTITFNNNETISAGTPFLLKPSSDKTNLEISGSALKDVSGQIVVNGGDYNFVGSLEPVQPADGSYYLSANNTIRPLASGGTIKGFRAYFEPATPNAAKARALSIDGMTTAIEDIVGGEELFGIPQKVYTINGQYAGDDIEALPKGVYIVNGKKIIK